jgi:hypothetical protein
MRRIAMEKINSVVYVFSTYLYTRDKIQRIGLILLLRDEEEGGGGGGGIKKDSDVL